MPRFCRVCWENDGVLASEVEQYNVDDPKRGYIKDCPIYTRCLLVKRTTRATCKTFHRWQTNFSDLFKSFLVPFCAD